MDTIIAKDPFAEPGAPNAEPQVSAEEMACFNRLAARAAPAVAAK
jgi:hypothetical protein